MDWKDFLKPDWKKIILAVIILFLLPFFFYAPMLCLFGECPPMLGFHFFAFPSAFGLFSSVLRGGIINNIYVVAQIILMFIMIAISYLISCLSVFAYNKPKR